MIEKYINLMVKLGLWHLREGKKYVVHKKCVPKSK